MNFAYVYNEGAGESGSVGEYFAFRSEPDNTCLIRQQLEMWLYAEQQTRIQKLHYFSFSFVCYRN